LSRDRFGIALIHLATIRFDKKRSAYCNSAKKLRQEYPNEKGGLRVYRASILALFGLARNPVSDFPGAWISPFPFG
jgi:hypothetical protein